MKKVLLALALVSLSITSFWLLSGGFSTSSAQPQSDSTVLEHDFGIVEAGAEFGHLFTVKNQSDEPWVVQKVKTTCRCTVAEIAKPSVSPGEDLEITVAYTAPELTTSELRRIFVSFENDVPPLTLEIKADIRKRLSVDLDRLVFARIRENDRPTKRVVVENYGTEPWRYVTAASTPPWLLTTATKLSREIPDQRLLECWAIDFEIDRALLTGSQVTADIEIVAELEGGAHLRSPFSITADPLEAISVFPNQLVLNDSTSNNVQRRLTVRFEPGSAPQCADELRVEHDLGEGFELNLVKIFSKQWNLECRVLSAVPDRGTIKIGFKGERQFEVPVKVLRNSENQENQL